MAGQPKTRAKKKRLAEVAAIHAAVAFEARPLDPDVKTSDAYVPRTGAQAPQSPQDGRSDNTDTNPPATRRTAALGLPLGSDETSIAVLELTVAGVPAERIAKYIDCTVEELREHHQRQLDVAVDEAVRSVGRSLMLKAKLGDTAAALAVLKTHAPETWDRGKTNKVEVTGAGGAPLEIKVKHELIERIMAAMPAPLGVELGAVGKLKLPSPPSVEKVVDVTTETCDKG